MPPAAAATIGFSDQANHQYDSSDFWRAAGAGNLPAVSFLETPSHLDGQRLPEWESTAVIISYDMPPVVSEPNTHLDALTGIGSCGFNAAAAQQRSFSSIP